MDSLWKFLRRRSVRLVSMMALKIQYRMKPSIQNMRACVMLVYVLLARYVFWGGKGDRDNRSIQNTLTHTPAALLHHCCVAHTIQDISFSHFTCGMWTDPCYSITATRSQLFFSAKSSMVQPLFCPTKLSESLESFTVVGNQRHAELRRCELDQHHTGLRQVEVG